MATDKPRKTDILTPLRDGEFWRITGIGEATEKRLYAAGIQTFRQLAKSTPEEIAAVLQGQVGVKERAARQDWMGQAARLAEAVAQEEPLAVAQEEHLAAASDDPPMVEEPVERQLYETFLLELLLDEDNSQPSLRTVRRTRVSNVRGGKKGGWAGWDSARLNSWIAEQAKLSSEPLARAARSRREIDGMQMLPEVSVAAAGINPPKHFFDYGQPLELRLTVDMSATEFTSGDAITYQVLVEARALGTGEQHTVGETRGTWDGTPRNQLIIPLLPLDEGTYRMLITLHVYPEDTPFPEQDGARAFREGGLVHIYDRVPAAG